MSKKKKWTLIAVGTALIVGAGSLVTLNATLSRIEPVIREQAIQYLRRRFDAEVELAALHVQIPATPRLRLWLARGRGVLAMVSGEGVVVRRKSHPEEPPILAIKTFSFQVDVGRILNPRKEVASVTLDGLQVHVPPKNERPALARASGNGDSGTGVVIDEIQATNTLLVIHPANPEKKPLEFDIQRLRLQDAGSSRPMTYEASLTNPKPPGQIESKGTFGPWMTDDPGSSPMQGNYTFSNADLGVFKAIAGTLESRGTFEGELSSVQVHGEARVPDFRLKRAGNPMLLHTEFDVEVDGTNGNTILKPVRAQLGSTRFTTSGAVIKHKGDLRRTIDLSANVSAGRLEDFLRLAMKGSPFMEGALDLNTTIQIPPLEGKVVEKLRLKGVFAVKNGTFLKSRIQDRLDQLSRKGQGEPKNEGIDEVVSQMAGAFAMRDQVIEFTRLGFGVPGANVDLAGSYDLDEEALDFHGSLRLDAKVSETQTGVKRWFLKPLNPFFAKNGAGTLLRFNISGTRDTPNFGVDLN